MRAFLRDDSGATIAKYGLLLACVAILFVGTVMVFGSSIRSWFEAKTGAITNPAPTQPAGKIAPLPP